MIVLQSAVVAAFSCVRWCLQHLLNFANIYSRLSGEFRQMMSWTFIVYRLAWQTFAEVEELGGGVFKMQSLFFGVSLFFLANPEHARAAQSKVWR